MARSQRPRPRRTPTSEVGSAGTTRSSVSGGASRRAIRSATSSWASAVGEEAVEQGAARLVGLVGKAQSQVRQDRHALRRATGRAARRCRRCRARARTRSASPARSRRSWEKATLRAGCQPGPRRTLALPSGSTIRGGGCPAEASLTVSASGSTTARSSVAVPRLSSSWTKPFIRSRMSDGRRPSSA